MLSQPGNSRIWLCTQPTDMRCSFDGLSARVRNHLGYNPLCGDWFVFLNRRRTMMKVLHYAPGGYVLWCKRLEQGTFARLQQSQLTLSELMLLIDGVEVKTLRRRHRFQPESSALRQSLATCG